MTLLQIEADSLPFLKQMLEARGYVQEPNGWRKQLCEDKGFGVVWDVTVPQWSGSGWVVKIKV